MRANKWENTIYGIIGQRLKELREEAGLSQSAVAMEIGLNQMSVVNYENGKRLPQADTLRTYAEFFNCTTDYLLGLSDYKNAYTQEEFAQLNNDLAGQLNKMEHKPKDTLIRALTNFVDATESLVGVNFQWLPFDKRQVKCLGGISNLLNAYAEYIKQLRNLAEYDGAADDENFLPKFAQHAKHLYKAKELEQQVREANDKFTHALFDMSKDILHEKYEMLFSDDVERITIEDDDDGND